MDGATLHSRGHSRRRSGRRARVAHDGPISFPDTMFANQLFRESIQALEKLGRISVEPGSSPREKTIYELGPDGKPRQPPAAPKPLSVSPKLTTYKPEARRCTA